MFIVYFIIGLCALQHFRVQATVSITFNDVFIDVLDPKYFNANDTLAQIEEDDDTMITLRVSIIKPLPGRGDCHMTMFGLSMGEYIMPTGLDVAMKLCDMIEEPIAMGPMFSAMGFVKGACPVPPGTYGIERYKQPVENFPDEFRENKYQSKLEISLDGKIILAARIIVDVRNEYDR